MNTVINSASKFHQTALLRTGQLRIQHAQRPLIEALNWEVSAGQFWCVLGRNGAGKTSLLNVVAGLAQPAGGRIHLHGKALDAITPHELARVRGLLQQHQIDTFSSSVIDTVLAGRFPWRDSSSWGNNEQDRRVALAALAALNMQQHAQRDVLHLSGGERQRVALATLLTQAPELLLLDEPTSHQDIPAQMTMMRFLRTLAEQQGKALIASCHDINLAARFATHALLLGEGECWQGRVADVLNVANLERVFGSGFERVETVQGAVYLAR
ncbi:ABC transporter ATP-binding protein [Herbaspirillum lusitanum]|uniref:ABC transporter ATP-binding protein n=1 Tax=Herbaspirillum lusitanum TaxID=213312 RepID=A0ABW9AAT5_9BURK